MPGQAWYGIHTARALENFHILGRPVAGSLVAAMAEVKLACALTNAELGYLDATQTGAIVQACEEVIAGGFNHDIVVDALQGGAGTSLNMNLNEVIANRAEVLLGGERGQYLRVHPLDHVNLHQSTNDVFPTALRIAAIRGLHHLEHALVALQTALQDKEQAFAAVLKLGRTQLQDACPTTLGASFAAWAEAIGRDRWRVFKCEERLRVVNLGGTAIGTGLAAPREYIFRVVERLREQTRLGLARAENLVEATQNVDAFVEVSGILKAHSVNLFKISSDLRLLASSPRGGLGVKAETRCAEMPEGLGITLCVGEQSEATYARWFESGAHRYLLRMESFNPALFAALHPKEQTYAARRKALAVLKHLGYQVGTGVMIGLPGQSVDDLVDDLLAFRDLGVDMIGMGPYIPHEQAPLNGAEQIGSAQARLELSLRMIAATRLLLGNVNIAAPTALQALSETGREQGLRFGANVIMPQVTPVRVRSQYTLYDGKPCLDDNAEQCCECLRKRIESVGRRVLYQAWGDSAHFAQRQMLVRAQEAAQ